MGLLDGLLGGATGGWGSVASTGLGLLGGLLGGGGGSAPGPPAPPTVPGPVGPGSISTQYGGWTFDPTTGQQTYLPGANPGQNPAQSYYNNYLYNSLMGLPSQANTGQLDAQIAALQAQIANAQKQSQNTSVDPTSIFGTGLNSTLLKKNADGTYGMKDWSEVTGDESPGSVYRAWVNAGRPGGENHFNTWFQQTHDALGKQWQDAQAKAKGNADTAAQSLAQQQIQLKQLQDLHGQAQGMQQGQGPANPFMDYLNSTKMQAPDTSANANYWGFGQDKTPFHVLSDSAMPEVNDLLSKRMNGAQNFSGPDLMQYINGQQSAASDPRQQAISDAIMGRLGGQNAPDFLSQFRGQSGANGLGSAQGLLDGMNPNNLGKAQGMLDAANPFTNQNVPDARYTGLADFGATQDMLNRADPTMLHNVPGTYHVNAPGVDAAQNFLNGTHADAVSTPGVDPKAMDILSRLGGDASSYDAQFGLGGGSGAGFDRVSPEQLDGSIASKLLESLNQHSFNNYAAQRQSEDELAAKRGMLSAASSELSHGRDALDLANLQRDNELKALQMANDTKAQQFGMNLNAANANNSNWLSRLGFALNARNTGNSTALGAANAMIGAGNQDFQNRLASQGQQFGQQISLANAQSALSGQDFSQRMGAADQNFSQDANQFGLQQDALSREFANRLGLSSAQAGLTGQQQNSNLATNAQNFGQDVNLFGLKNQAAQQQFANLLGLGNANAALAGQQFGQQGNLVGLQSNLASQGFNQDMGMTNQGLSQWQAGQNATNAANAQGLNWGQQLAALQNQGWNQAMGRANLAGQQTQLGWQGQQMADQGAYNALNARNTQQQQALQNSMNLDQYNRNIGQQNFGNMLNFGNFLSGQNMNQFQQNMGYGGLNNQQIGMGQNVGMDFQHQQNQANLAQAGMQMQYQNAQYQNQLANQNAQSNMWGNIGSTLGAGLSSMYGGPTTSQPSFNSVASSTPSGLGAGYGATQGNWLQSPQTPSNTGYMPPYQEKK